MEETILLNFEVDQSQAERDLVQTEKNILAVKKQQTELNKEYKAGKITEDEYVKSNIKLQQSLKKEVDQKGVLNRALATESNSRNAMRQRVSDLSKEYNNLNQKTEAGAKRSKELQAELTKLNESLNKGSKAAGQFKDNIGNYPEQLSAAVNQVKPFGLSIDGAAGSMAKFLTPATAAIGILAGLTSAYAASSTGAKDLAFAQDRLTFLTSSFIETLGTLVGGKGEGGEGLFNKLIDGAIEFVKVIPGLNLALLALQATTGVSVDSINAQSKAFAAAREELRKLEIESTRAQGFAKFFENAAENARRLRDDEEKILSERLKASSAVEQNLQANATVRLNVINQEIEAIKKANINWQNQDAIVLQIEQKRAQSRDIEEEINGKLTENFKARVAISKAISEQNAADRRASSKEVRSSKDGVERQDRPDPLQGAFDTQLNKEQEVEITERFNKRIVDANAEADAEIRRNRERSAEGQLALDKRVNETKLQLVQGFLGAAASLFDEHSAEYKAFATFETIISTYAAAQKAFESQAGIPYVGPALGAAAAALAIVQGLANVAAIHGVQFAEGGFTPKGPRDKAVGVVHAGEYVTPQHLVNSPAAQPHIQALESMRLRPYADGGFVTNQNTSQAQQSLLMINAIKHLPQPVLGVEEVTRVQKRISVRDNVARIGGRSVR